MRASGTRLPGTLAAPRRCTRCKISATPSVSSRRRDAGRGGGRCRTCSRVCCGGGCRGVRTRASPMPPSSGSRSRDCGLRRCPRRSLRRRRVGGSDAPRRWRRWCSRSTVVAIAVAFKSGPASPPDVTTRGRLDPSLAFGTSAPAESPPLAPAPAVAPAGTKTSTMKPTSPSCPDGMRSVGARADGACLDEAEVSVGRLQPLRPRRCLSGAGER